MAAATGTGLSTNLWGDYGYDESYKFESAQTWENQQGASAARVIKGEPTLTRTMINGQEFFDEGQENNIPVDPIKFTNKFFSTEEHYPTDELNVPLATTVTSGATTTETGATTNETPSGTTGEVISKMANPTLNVTEEPITPEAVKPEQIINDDISSEKTISENDDSEINESETATDYDEINEEDDMSEIDDSEQ